MDKLRDIISQSVNLPTEELDRIVSIVKVFKVKKGEFLIKEGRVANKIGRITQGAVRAYYTDKNNEEHVLGLNFEGDMLVAYESFIYQTPAKISAVALEDTYGYYTTYDDYKALIRDYPKYEAYVREGVGEFMLQKVEYIKLLRSASAKERYETLLAQKPFIVNRVPLKYIASYLGITKETMSRIRKVK